ncbi:GvpL/GvpF family gas vesicle protein [Streptomyces avicenniae]|uniref:GvpL/GvpF family gas vesicle protein n=1 Tax=Streptomyces avicenniae TaxID=500153 RepID=UPI00069BC892|nr:GvpL/GvpF family gas vesicle protein [Streptomyces avicenniae]
MSTYVYGITHAGLPRLPAALAGVGDPPRAVRVLRAGGVAAVVSDCPEGLRPTRRALFAHQRVLSSVSGAATVLPLRFGSVAPDDRAVRALLTGRSGPLREQLELVAGRVEFTVRGMHLEDVLLRGVVARDPEIQRLDAAARASGGGTYTERRRLGELLAEAVEAQTGRDVAAVRDGLAPLAAACRTGPGGGGLALHLAFLVDRDRAADFLTTVPRLQERLPHLELGVNGPLPPYGFAGTAGFAGLFASAGSRPLAAA